MDDLQIRVEQFNALELPGQPLSMHMGTSYLVSDLWREVQSLRQQVAALEGAAAKRETPIAAASDLLEALRGVVAVADRNTDVFAKARAAIARAVEPT